VRKGLREDKVSFGLGLSGRLGEEIPEGRGRKLAPLGGNPLAEGLREARREEPPQEHPDPTRGVDRVTRCRSCGKLIDLPDLSSYEQLGVCRRCSLFIQPSHRKAV